MERMERKDWQTPAITIHRREEAVKQITENEKNSATIEGHPID